MEVIRYRVLQHKARSSQREPLGINNRSFFQKLRRSANRVRSSKWHMKIVTLPERANVVAGDDLCVIFYNCLIEKKKDVENIRKWRLTAGSSLNSGLSDEKIP